jgi:hypothetical protein
LLPTAVWEHLCLEVFIFNISTGLSMIRPLSFRRALTLAVFCAGFLLLPGVAAEKRTSTHPIYPLPKTAQTELLQQTAPFLQMEERALLALVPPQGGFFYTDCPNCESGIQDRQITWNISLGDKVKCRYCKQIYPSEKYPENGEMAVKTPTGKTQIFKYFEDKDGNKYFMQARRWYEQRNLMEKAAYDLAALYASDKTKYREAGRRSALILKRFAEVYPDYIARFDYPSKPKQFFPEGFPKKFTPYRASKWYWWGYGDISRQLLLTYDILKSGDVLNEAGSTLIERDLFQAMLDWVANNDGTPLTNMHPSLWSSMVIASRVLDDPVPAQKVRQGMQRLLGEQFFIDGIWQEGSPSYHRQTTQGLLGVLRMLRPELSAGESDKIALQENPELKRAFEAVNELRLPSGHSVALKDTWASESGPPLEASHPILLPGLGYAILGMGEGAGQMQAHLNFTGRYGHHHFDSLNLLLFGAGEELFSDIGYTHSRARGWTISTAAHNTVVIDQKSQATGNAANRVNGNLQLYDAGDENFQIVEAAVPGAYPDLATTYRRALAAVSAPDGTKYVVDVFDVAGGKRHDWMLHGSADHTQTLELVSESQPLKMQPVASLLPENFKWKAPLSEGDAGLAGQDSWAYGVFRDAHSADADDTVVATYRAQDNPQQGARSWILGAPKTRYTTARAWATRNTGVGFKQDDALLDKGMREALIVTRAGPVNRFIAVHCPFNGEVAVKNVTAIPLQPDGVALKIERTGGTDYVLYAEDAKPRHGRDGTLEISFDGRAALAQQDGEKRILKMIGGTAFTIGNQKLSSDAGVLSAPLQEVRGNEYVVPGVLPLAAGDTFILRHGNERSTAFHVQSVRRENNMTILKTMEPPAFSGAAHGELKQQFFPQDVFPAPHTVIVSSRAQSK